MDHEREPEEQLEPTLDVEISPMMEPHSVLAEHASASATPSPRYWQAQGLAAAIHHDFEEAQKRGDTATLRNKFYVLARYYGRTLAILHHALKDRKESLLTAALHNLIALHLPLHHMHEIAPTSVPLALTLNRRVRRRLIEDLIVEVLQEAAGTLDAAAITRQVNDLHLLANTEEEDVHQHMDNLTSAGYVERDGAGYRRTHRVYNTVNLDRAGLEALLEEELYDRFEEEGFYGLEEVAGRRAAFVEFFTGITGFSRSTAELFAAAAKELVGPPSVAPDLSSWHHSDVIGSVYPRPYQHDAYSIFHGYGYHGQVIEAPTGSGKTLIGMMCIQDWMRSMSSGETILILVPTVNYQQQWFGELCYKNIGLHLSPDLIFTGTPAGLEEEVAATGVRPLVLVMTYAALAQTGSGLGKGGFDQDSIEIFIQENNIRYVILDEAHKVVENLRSVSADVTRLLTEWLRDGSLQGVIGFSGTAAAYRQRFTKLGLDLVYTMPAADLIAYGFVAPFAEIGVPFTYSDREQDIRNLLEEYKELLHQFALLAGSPRLRQWFADLPVEDRVRVARDLLRMYAGRKDRDEALAGRMREWESGNDLNLTELPLVTIVQILSGMSDRQMIDRAAQDLSAAEGREMRSSFGTLLDHAGSIREQLKEKILFPEIIRCLDTKNFGTDLDADGLLDLPSTSSSAAALADQVRYHLSTTLVGLYDSLRTFYFRTGEGRLDTINAIIKAERASRPISGVIVFDAGKRLQWEKGTAVPGYAGVAGVFGQMLGERGFTPMAVLSGEIYLPWDDKDPINLRIARYIQKDIILEELGEVFFDVVTQGLEIDDKGREGLRKTFDFFLSEYIESLENVHAARPGQFNRKVVKPIRRAVGHTVLGEEGRKLQARLDMKHQYLKKWVEMLFDYALIATYFVQATVSELQQVSGEIQRFFVVKMPAGDRKQFMYDLTARIVDAENLPVNMIIVSTWARTGWNVIRPNLLIDATATRNVTAWQQLRGRAMRAMSTWNQDCYRLVMALLGSQAPGIDESDHLPADVMATVEEFRHGEKRARILDERSRALLLESHRQAMEQAGKSGGPDDMTGKIKDGKLSRFSALERQQMVVELMMSQNKVTHIYELVKAYGSTSQVVRGRDDKVWRRKDSIAAKHAHEYSVNPLTGWYGSGEDHAPLIHSGDPRTNLPSRLRRTIVQELKGCDPTIVSGWLKALASGLEEDLTLE